MARRELGPAALQVVRALDAAVSGPMLVACSGGADSLALAATAAIVARRRKLPLRAIVVDHSLQQGSADVAAAVVAQLAGIGIRAEVLAVTVSASGDGIEAAARHARYAALDAAAKPDEVVLLGHTLDDQAETVLLGLARGSGTRSLAGMPARRGRFLRPLLGVRAEVTRQACLELGLQPWSDPHNAQPRFTRVRVRQRVLPALEAELGPGVAEALSRSAELARIDADLLDELAARELAGRDGDQLDCAWLAGLPQALLSRVLRDWLRGHGATDLSAGHLVSVGALVIDWHGQRWVDLPRVRVFRRDGRVQVRQR